MVSSKREFSYMVVGPGGRSVGWSTFRDENRGGDAGVEGRGKRVGDGLGGVSLRKGGNHERKPRVKNPEIRFAFTRYCFTSKLYRARQASLCPPSHLQSLPDCNTSARPLRNIHPLTDPPPFIACIIQYW